VKILSGCANYLNPKSEARNKCKIPILKFSKPAQLVVSNFEFFSFGFVSDFDIRISDLVAVMVENWFCASSHG